MDYSAVGKRIKISRKKKGYTQAELAEILGYSIQHISHIENGITKMSIDFIIALANVLEVSLDELFQDSLSFGEKDTEGNNLSVLLDSCSDSEKEKIKRILIMIQAALEICLDELK